MHIPRRSPPPSHLGVRHLPLWAISQLARLDGGNHPTKEVSQTGVTLDHLPILPLHHQPQSRPADTPSPRPRLLRRHTSIIPPLLQRAEQRPSYDPCSAPSKRLPRHRRMGITKTEVEAWTRAFIRNGPPCVSLLATPAARKRSQSRGPLHLHPAHNLRQTPNHASLPSPSMIAFDGMPPHD
jgi:hypothetical protein